MNNNGTKVMEHVLRCPYASDRKKTGTWEPYSRRHVSFWQRHGSFWQRHGSFWQHHGSFWQRHGSFWQRHGSFWQRQRDFGSVKELLTASKWSNINWQRHESFGSVKMAKYGSKRQPGVFPCMPLPYSPESIRNTL